MSITASTSPGALTGVRVLDFTGVVAGPYCTRLLADLGAEVIKIESPAGDLLRLAQPRRHGYSAYFAPLNAGKQSLCLDLKQPRAVELVLQLTEKSDVAVQNFRPGVMRDFGLGYEQLKARNPKIIYCNMSGFGQEGPAADWAAFAPIIHAAAGLDFAMMQWQDDVTKPHNGSVPFADYMTGVHGNSAIMAALFRRERTGLGEEIDIAMTEVIYNALTFELQEANFGLVGGRLKYRVLRAKEGLFVVNPLSPKNFIDLCTATGHPEWLEKFPLRTSERTKNWLALLGAVEEWAQQYTAEECERIISAGGCPVARLRTIKEALDEPQAQFRNSSVVVEDGAGPLTVANTPLRMRESEAGIGARVPGLGAQTAQVLESVLGLSPSEIDKLVQAKVAYREIAPT